MLLMVVAGLSPPSPPCNGSNGPTYLKYVVVYKRTQNGTHLKIDATQGFCRLCF